MAHTLSTRPDELFYFESGSRVRLYDEQVKINGEKFGEFDSHPGSVTSYFDVIAYDVHTVTLESLGLDKDEWISLLEVSNAHFLGVSVLPS